MPPDDETLARAVRAAVRTHKLLSFEQARRYCDLVGLPRATLDE